MTLPAPAKTERHEFTVWRQQINDMAAAITDTPYELLKRGDECFAAKCYGLASKAYDEAFYLAIDRRIAAAQTFELHAKAVGNSTAVYFARKYRNEIIQSNDGELGYGHLKSELVS